MPWRGINGASFPVGTAWLGRRGSTPHGHGVLVYPPGSSIEFSEGAMTGGRRQGQRVRKDRDGSWRLHQFKDDEYHDIEVPLPPRPSPLPVVEGL